MNFTASLFVVLFCGFAVAQNKTTETEVTAETQSCFPDMGKFLEDFGAMKVKQEAMEARLRDSENQILELKSKGKVELLL